MMMKANRLAVTLAWMTLAVPATQALAGPIGTTGSFSLTRVDGLKAGAGGEFTVYDIKDGAGQASSTVTNDSYSANPSTKDVVTPFPSGTTVIANSLQTFCLEMTENALTTATNYFVVNSSAAAGGGGSLDANGSVNGRDAISKGTAWLYSQFARGTLNVAKVSTAVDARGDYFSPIAPGRAAEADALQHAIWWLETEAAPTPDKLAANPYYMAAMDQFKDEVGGATADAAVGFLGVYVLNNFVTKTALDTFLATGDIFATPRKERAQDFLFYAAEVSVPDGGTTAMLLGVGLVALGLLRQRRSF